MYMNYFFSLVWNRTRTSPVPGTPQQLPSYHQIYHPIACLSYMKVASQKSVVAKWRYQQRKCKLITDNQDGNQSTPMWAATPLPKWKFSENNNHSEFTILLTCIAPIDSGKRPKLLGCSMEVSTEKMGTQQCRRRLKPISTQNLQWFHFEMEIQSEWRPLWIHHLQTCGASDADNGLKLFSC